MVLGASIDLAREIRGAGPLAMISALQAVRDSGEEAESHAQEKLLRSRDPNQAFLQTRECRYSQGNDSPRVAITGGLYCHSRDL